MAEKLLFMMPGREALTIQGLVALYEAIKGRPATAVELAAFHKNISARGWIAKRADAALLVRVTAVIVRRQLQTCPTNVA